MTSDSQAVTVLGLGSMGSALAATLLDQGHPTTVWNRSADKAKPLVDKGARLAAT
ncbi:NAD(P)-binding domain-containing protein, partial [Actinomadura adrarensis]